MYNKNRPWRFSRQTGLSKALTRYNKFAELVREGEIDVNDLKSFEECFDNLDSVKGAIREIWAELLKVEELLNTLRAKYGKDPILKLMEGDSIL